ncbi:uncharacterized protein LOC112179439 [Rosa chinensis]|uniref:uncharacterized protein LOC112179439 n=1 Tax=Rosa chinensis TaxID=74649 RepID=UPI001AD91278|nr:uncharacterized protein LOC112179439 [Rosa chinensis]
MGFGRFSIICILTINMEPGECSLCGCTQTERSIGYPLVPNPATSPSSKGKGFEDAKSVEVKWWFSNWSSRTLLSEKKQFHNNLLQLLDTKTVCCSQQRWQSNELLKSEFIQADFLMRHIEGL